MAKLTIILLQDIDADSNLIEQDNVHAIPLSLEGNAAIEISATLLRSTSIQDCAIMMWISKQPYGVVIQEVEADLNHISLLTSPSFIYLIGKEFPRTIEDVSQVKLDAGTYYLNLQNRTGSPQYYNLGIRNSI